MDARSPLSCWSSIVTLDATPGDSGEKGTIMGEPGSEAQQSDPQPDGSDIEPGTTFEGTTFEGDPPGTTFEGDPSQPDKDGQPQQPEPEQPSEPDGGDTEPGTTFEG